MLSSTLSNLSPKELNKGGHKYERMNMLALGIYIDQGIPTDKRGKLMMPNFIPSLADLVTQCIDRLTPLTESQGFESQPGWKRESDPGTVGSHNFIVT